MVVTTSDSGAPGSGKPDSGNSGAGRQKSHRSLSRRLLRWAAWSLAGLAIMVALLLIGINTGAGKRLLVRQVTALSGGTVRLSGVSGTLPWHLSIDHLDVRDHKGPWLTLQALDVRWSPLALVIKKARIRSLNIKTVNVLRAPLPTAQTAVKASSGPPSVPAFGAQLDWLSIGRIQLDAGFAGEAVALTLNGHLFIETIAPFLKPLSPESLPNMDVGMDVVRLGQAGHLNVNVKTPPRQILVRLVGSEGAGGFVSTRAGLKPLDPLTIGVQLSGPRDEAFLSACLIAGPTQIDAVGKVNLYAHTMDLHLKGNAPSMTLRPGIGWNSIVVDTILHGSLTMPIVQGMIDVDSLAAGGTGIGHMKVRFDGHELLDPMATFVRANAQLTALRLPVQVPNVMADAPLNVDIVAYPRAPYRPVKATVSHPLMTLGLTATLAPTLQSHMTLNLPRLGPLARAVGAEASGHAALEADLGLPLSERDDMTLAGEGTVALSGAPTQAVNLIGPDGHLSFALSHSTTRGTNLRHVTFAGKAFALEGHGALSPDPARRVQAALDLSLTDLARISPALRGEGALKVMAEGALNDLAMKAALTTTIGVHDVPKGPLAFDVSVQHLPSRPDGHISGNGTIDRMPFQMQMDVHKNENGAVFINIARLAWNSLKGTGTLRLPPGHRVPLGTLDLAVRNLSDFRRLTGQNISGHLALGLRTIEAGRPSPRVLVGLNGAFALPQAGVRALNLKGFVDDPAGTPAPDMTLDLEGVRVHPGANGPRRQGAEAMTGSAHATMRGPQSAMKVAVSGAFRNVLSAPAQLDTAMTLNIPDKRLQLEKLSALIKGEHVTLTAPALILFGKQMGVDHLHLTLAPPGVAPTVIDMRGQVKPGLAFDGTVSNLRPAVARPFMPDLKATGTITAQAHLTGTLEAPFGTIALNATALHMTAGPGTALPPITLKSHLAFAGSNAQLDARLDGGSRIALAANGMVPLAAAGPLSLTTRGLVDLDVANALLGAQGMEAHGRITLAMRVNGTAAQPQATGTVNIQNASFDSYAQGVRLSAIDGTLAALGDTVSFQHILAHAGQGTIAIDGSFGLFRPGLPVDLTVVSRKATPITSDLITATINTDLRLHGQATTRLDVDGHVGLPAVTVNIPDAMPASVPQLNVIRPGQKAALPASSLVIGLGVEVTSPGHFRVRGHGLDAEMAGHLHINGTTAAPVVTGGFDLRRGNFNLAGINLNFTHGRVGFNGTGVNHRLDPTLDFRADRNAKGTLASLLVTGYASAPKLDFVSTPTQPKDETLAVLLFGTDSHSLSATQLAELGAAVAQLAGRSSFDPLGKVRNALGLDRLAIGGGSGVNNGGTSVEAGKYVMKGVYVGAKQATSGAGTQAQVQVDLTKRLKLNTTVGTGGQVTGFTTPENDPGSSVGLSYGYDY